jgi:tetratricopeptide (TPR) repeat protein
LLYGEGVTPTASGGTSDVTSRDIATRFVGRAGALAQASSMLDAGAHGASKLLLVSGEAGSGKSFLIEQLVADRKRDGALVLWSSWTGLPGPPLWSWYVIVRAIDPERAELMANSSRELFERCQIVIDAVRDAAATMPVLLIIDDAEKSDDATMALAKSLTRVLRALPVQVIVGWQTQRGVPPPELLISSGAWIHLEQLSDAEARQLAIQSSGDITLDQAQLDEVLAISAGNPLLISHAVAAAAANRSSELGSAGVIRSRVRSLEPSHRDILAVAASLCALTEGPTSIEHVAQSLNCEVSAVQSGVQAGRLHGLVREVGVDDRDRIEFTHEAVRAEFALLLDPDRQRQIHLRRYEALDVDGGLLDITRSTTHAAHALAAWPLLETTAVVNACRAAARSLLEHANFRPAIDLLQRAIEIEENSGTGSVSTSLLIEHAEATLASGRLADARVRFRRAVDAAHGVDDHEVIGRAALGLGGVWVHEHRSPSTLHEYLGLVDRAIDGETDPLRLQLLRARRASEQMYIGEANRIDLADIIEAIRSHQDQPALARALSMLHHTQLGADFAHERIAIAHEVLVNGSRGGDSLMAVMGTMWLAVDNYLIGDPSATRWHEELRDRAASLDLPALGFIAEAMDVMLLLRAGRFADAEELAGACAATGSAAGDLDATGYYGAHIMCSRWMQGTSADLIPALTHLTADTPRLAGGLFFSAVHASLAADAGRVDEARSVLNEVARLNDRVSQRSIRNSSVGMANAYSKIHAASVVGDRELARSEASWLSRFAGLPVMASLAVTCFGSAEFPLGLAARVDEQLDDAMLHLSRAAAANQRLGNRPAEALALAEWAETAAQSGDRSRARALWSEAIDLGTSLGMTARVDRWARRRDEVRSPSPSPVGRLSKRGAIWTFSIAGADIVTPDSVGLGHLASLIANAPNSVSVNELTGASSDPSEQEVLDPVALGDYRRRLRELEEDMAEADAFADVERSARARAEFDAVLDTIRRQLRPDGTSRRFGGQSERARSAVQKAIRRAIDRVGETSPELADALRASVSTGFECRFVPVDSLPSTWIVSTA